MPEDKRILILLVEDDEVDSKLVVRALQKRRAHFRVTTARSLLEAGQFLNDTHPDLIIADQALTDGEGIELLARDDVHRRVPVVMLTGRGDEDLAVKAMKAGAVDYVVKSRATMLNMVSLVERALRTWQYIVDRQRAESALQRSEETARALLDACPYLAMLIDMQGTILAANEAMATALGHTSTALVGQCVFEPTSREWVMASQEQVQEVIRSRGPVQGEEHHGARMFTTRLHPLPDERGEVERIAVFARDVTDRKELEEQLRQSTKMTAVGELAGGIAHDFNNLLAGILGEASMLKLESPPGSSAHSAAKTIEEAATQMADLTRQLMGFARRGKYQTVPVDVHESIREAASLLRRSMPKNIDLNLDLRAQNATVNGDPNQIEQIMLNLALNARDAMPDGGELVFRTAGFDTRDGSVEGVPGLVPSTYLKIEVTDTGHGIPEEIRDRIFEPYFTTREPAKGTGMGLATVYGIVINHGGAICVEGTPGMGATFSVYLPSAHKAADPKQRAVVDAPSDRKRRVLLVDDEEMLRNVVSRMLRRMDYEVVTASNGQEAVDHYRQHADEIDLVVLDMMMPVMGGRDCFRALKSMDPEVKVLLSTGSALEGQAQEIMAEGVLGFVQKPYRMDELGKQVRQIMENGPAQD